MHARPFLITVVTVHVAILLADDTKGSYGGAETGGPFLRRTLPIMGLITQAFGPLDITRKSEQYIPNELVFVLVLASVWEMGKVVYVNFFYP